MKRHLSPADLTIGLVTTADAVRTSLVGLDLGHVETVAYDSY